MLGALFYTKLQRVVISRASAECDLNIAEALHGTTRRDRATGGSTADDAWCGLVVVRKNLQVRRLVADVIEIQDYAAAQLLLEADEVALHIASLEGRWN